MSYKAVALAFEITKGITSTEKFVLVALAERHNKDTHRCDPSVPRLAVDCNLDVRTVQRVLKRLTEKGLIRITARCLEIKRPRSNSYELLFVDAVVARGVVALCQGGGGAVPPEPVIEPGKRTDDEGPAFAGQENPLRREEDQGGRKTRPTPIKDGWTRFEEDLDQGRSLGVLSPIHVPGAYATKCARNRSHPPSGVDTLLLIEFGVAVKEAAGLDYVRLPPVHELRRMSRQLTQMRLRLGDSWLGFLTSLTKAVLPRLDPETILIDLPFESGFLSCFREFVSAAA